MSAFNEVVNVEGSGGSVSRGRVRLHLVRHGEPRDTAGEADPGLTARGHRQARALATRLETIPFVAVYISPLRRAIETAQPLLTGRDDVPVHITADLHEVLKEHVLVTAERAPVSIRQILEQERDAMLRFVNRVRHTHNAGDNIVIVAHGNIIRSLIPIFGGRDPAGAVLIEVYHAALCIVDLWPSAARAVLMLGNGTRHLVDADVTG